MELFKEFLNSSVLVYTMYFYLFCLLFYMIYCILNYFKFHSRMKEKIINLYSQMNEQERLRAETERQKRDIHGVSNKRDWLARTDERLAYSGIKEKLRWVTTEIYMMFVIVVTSLVGIIATLKLGFLLGCILAIFVVMIFELIVTILVSYRDKKTEAIMLQFMNIVDNFSKTSDDLISILEKASRYIDEPLASQIYDAVLIAKNTGDKLSAIQDLQDRVKNRHFKVLMRNLEISSRYETNYSDIVEDCRGIFHNYIKSEKEKRLARHGGVLEILVMLASGFGCMYILGDIAQTESIFLDLLTGGALAHFILGYLIFSLLASVFIIVFKIYRN